MGAPPSRNLHTFSSVEADQPYPLVFRGDIGVIADMPGREVVGAQPGLCVQILPHSSLLRVAQEPSAARRGLRLLSWVSISYYGERIKSQEQWMKPKKYVSISQ